MAKKRRKNHTKKKHRKRTRYNTNRVFQDYITFSRNIVGFNKLSKSKQQKIKRDFTKDHRRTIKDRVKINRRLYKNGDIVRDSYLANRNRLRREEKYIKGLRVCLDRKKRRESLFAFKKIGSGISVSPRRIFKKHSKVRC